MRRAHIRFSSFQFWIGNMRPVYSYLIGINTLLGSHLFDAINMPAQTHGPLKEEPIRSLLLKRVSRI